MNPQRVQEPIVQRCRVAPRRCEAPNCSAATREGKPYCTEHIAQHPYVVDLLAALDQRDEDDAVAAMHYDRRRAGVNLQGITAQEIVMHLSVNGPRTAERLCRELSLDLQTLAGYIRALKRAKAVTETRSRRGSIVINLRNKEEDAA